MKKTIIILLLTAIASAAIAQTQKRDTVVLSVYNTNQRFMLYPMPFGKDRPDVDFTAPMLVVLDTIHTVEVSTRKDTTGKYPKRLITKRQCGKLPKDSLTGKVALLYMSAGCDVSTQVYNAQKSGAIVVIVIHTTDNRDSVELPKQGTNQVRYADASKVRIPCFTVRKGIGEKLTTMLPSVSGIQRPKTNVTNPATSVVANNPTILVAQQLSRDSLHNAEQAEQGKNSTNNPPPGAGGNWAISPNPAHDEVVLHYNFDKTGVVNIEVFNEIGQVLTSYQLPDTQTGELHIDVAAWQNGTYNVRLDNGQKKEVKRLVVLH
jgi:Secretion system C-terminal sorting domain/PA domain